MATGAASIRGLTTAERAAFSTAENIYGSGEFGVIRSAFEAGTAAEVNVGGVTVLYEPKLPASGMTLFGESAFVIGPEAFASEAELAQTILHESYRLTASASSGWVSGELATSATNAAASFAEQMLETLLGG